MPLPPQPFLLPPEVMHRLLRLLCGTGFPPLSSGGVGGPVCCCPFWPGGRRSPCSEPGPGKAAWPAGWVCGGREGLPKTAHCLVLYSEFGGGPSSRGTKNNAGGGAFLVRTAFAGL